MTSSSSYALFLSLGSCGALMHYTIVLIAFRKMNGFSFEIETPKRNRPDRVRRKGLKRHSIHKYGEMKGHKKASWWARRKPGLICLAILAVTTQAKDAANAVAVAGLERIWKVHSLETVVLGVCFLPFSQSVSVHMGGWRSEINTGSRVLVPLVLRMCYATGFWDGSVSPRAKRRPRSLPMQARLAAPQLKKKKRQKICSSCACYVLFCTNIVFSCYSKTTEEINRFHKLIKTQHLRFP